MASSPTPRPAVAGLPAYKPGRSAEAAMADHGLASAVKLASNELSFEPLPSVLAAIAAAGAATNRYPDHGAAALRRRLAEVHGLDVTQVTVGCGSVGLLQQLCLAYVDPGDEVAFGWRSFEAYPIHTAMVGGVAVTAPLRDQTVDLVALAEVIGARTKLVLLANPNNPTGTCVARADLDLFLDAVPETTLVVLDEAYAEFVTGAHVPDGLALVRAGRPNVCVLRTFSKAYGLAALRIGALFGPAAVVDAVDRILIPFSVNAAAQAAALASLEPAAQAELDGRVATVVGERTRVARALRARGLGVPESQANFTWLPVGEPAAALAAALESKGVVTRAFPGDGLRVTVGSVEENERLLDAVDGVCTDATFTADWPQHDDAAQRAQAWLDRAAAVRARLAALAATRRPGLTDPDPGGEERWDDGQVWAHLAELGDYWLAELALVLDGCADGGARIPFGRIKVDPARVAAIADGRHREPAAQVAAVLSALDRTSARIASLTDAQWAATGEHSTLGTMGLDDILHHFLVGHLEQHAAQLDTLAT